MVEEPTLEQTIDILLGHPRALRAAPQGHDHRRGRPGRGRPVDPLHHRPPPAGQGDRPHRRGGQPRPPPPRVGAARPARGAEGARAGHQGEGRRDQRPGVRGGRRPARGRGDRARSRSRACAPSGRPRSSSDQPTVGEEEIAQVVAMWTGIPVTRIAQEESERLLHMEDALHGRVIGQQEAIEIVSKAVRRARAGLKDPKRPIGSFIFLGPTGVGKTELAKALAEFMFGSEDALIKIDMSEFMERHNVVAPGRRASRLRRLRRGRPADRGRPPQELLRRPARRGREGPPGGVQHPPPDPRGRPPVRRQGPPGRLPQLDHHHDLEPRGEAAPDELDPRLPGPGRHGRDPGRRRPTSS